MEPCLFAKRTHLILPVPLFVCPGFLTELLLLKWRLHFEFTTSVSHLEGQNLQDEDKVNYARRNKQVNVQSIPVMQVYDEGSMNDLNVKKHSTRYAADDQSGSIDHQVNKRHTLLNNYNSAQQLPHGQ